MSIEVVTPHDQGKVPTSLKVFAAAFLLASLMLLGYEAQSARPGGDPTISFVIRHHWWLKLTVSAAAAIVALAMAFLTAHFGFNVA
jgi:hypothetical protein